MQAAMARYLATAWKQRQPGIAVATPREALILASIVEKETGKPSERRTVAAVYSNRLKRGMPLQADPTVIRSEEHTSELQSLMRIAYAVFCLQKKKRTTPTTREPTND